MAQQASMPHNSLSQNTRKSLLLALFITLTTSTSATFVTYYIKSLMTDNISRELTQTLDSASYQYKLLIEDKKQLAQFWANDPALSAAVAAVVTKTSHATESQSQLSALLADIQTAQKLMGLVVIKRDGQPLIAPAQQHAFANIQSWLTADILDSVWRGNTYSSRPHRTQYSTHHNNGGMETAIISILTPVYGSHQQPIAILAAYLDAHYITSFVLDHNKLGDYGFTLITDKTGHPLTLFSAQTATAITDADLSQLSADKTVKNLKGYTGYTDNRVVGAWQWNKALDIGFLTEADIDETYAIYFAIRDAIFIGASLVIMLALVAVELNRRKSKQSLINMELRNQIINNSADGIIVIDRRSTITVVNPAACEMFAYSAGELEGQSLTRLLPDDLRMQHSTYVTDSELNGSRNFNNMHRLYGRKRDGETFPIDLLISRMNMQGEEFFIGVIRDISDFVAKENELIEAKDSAQKALQAAENANKAKSRFLSKMNHELRTPLNSVIGFADLLELECEKQEEKELLSVIKSSGHHLLSLINTILDWAGAESGRLELNISTVNLNDLLTDVCAKSQNHLMQLNLSLDLSYATPEKYWVLADPYRLKQAFLNIVHHAAQYNKQEGYIALSVTEVDQNISINVHSSIDNIDDWMLNILASEFDSMDSIDGIKSSGLELLLAKDLIELMGGRIVIANNAEHEALLTIVLNRAVQPDI